MNERDPKDRAFCRGALRAGSDTELYMKDQIKKQICLLLTLCALLPLVACAGTVTKAPQGTTASPEETAKQTKSTEEPNRLTALKLSSGTMILIPGQQATLTVTAVPEDAADEALTWDSSAPEIVSVENGVCTGVSAGTAEITVSAANGVSAVCMVLVKENATPVSRVMIQPDMLELTEGESALLKATVSPNNATFKAITFASSDEMIATVDENGLVTAVKSGQCYVTATSEDGQHSAYCPVFVSSGPVAVTGVYLGNVAVTMNVGDTVQLSAAVKPENADNQNLLWSSSDEKIVTVKDGRLTAISDGKATVTVKTEEGGFSESCAVTVRKGPPPVVSIELNRSYIQLKKGSSETLKVTVHPEDADVSTLCWESESNKIASVERNGKVFANSVGTVKITCRTEDGGVSAVCTVVVDEDDDPIDKIDVSSAVTVDAAIFKNGLRVNTNGELLFSPVLSEFRDKVSSSKYHNYTAYLRFTYLPKNDDDPEFVYRSVALTPTVSKYDCVDFVLQGEDEDSGFCPTAGANYKVELVIVKNDAKINGLYIGSYTVKAHTEIKNSPFYNPTAIGGQTIRRDGEHVIRYVSAGNGYITGETKQLLEPGRGSTAVTAVPDDGYQFLMWSDGLQEATRKGDTVKEDTKLIAYFTDDKKDTNIADLYIFTDSKEPVTTKNYEGCSIVVKGTDGGKYDLTATAQIRGRGNSSWGTAPQSSYDSKNSYRLKLDEAVKLLGIGKGKNRDWVLQANKFDPSGLRNYLVWELANRMGTIPYVPTGTWVQLYVNNEYRGMYMVCELVEVAKDRVNIDDNLASTDKGYLMEFDFRGHAEDQPYFYIDGYGKDPKTHLYDAIEIVIKSDISGDEDLKFIEAYVKECDKAIRSGNREKIDELIDIPSLIDMYILEEWTKDCDVGRASFYVQKSPGGKLCFTAPWDFDFGFGTYGPATGTDGLVSGRHGAICPWYGALVKCAWFREEVVARMHALDGAFAETIKALRRKADELEGAIDMNAIFWNLYGTKYHPYVNSQVSRDLHSFDEHIDFLLDWAEIRWETLREILENGGE